MGHVLMAAHSDDSGAVGVVVVNGKGEELVLMAGKPRQETPPIPAIMVSYQTGQRIKERWTGRSTIQVSPSIIFIHASVRCSQE